MRTQPALSSSATLRYSAFGALYFAQGIPQGLQLFAIPGWMAMNGAEASVVGGYVGICTLPWTFKLIAGPLMDRYSFLPMGRRRPWLLGAQMGLLILMVVMAFVPDPLNNMSLFMAVSFVLNCFGAVQDVATDGLAVDITPVDQQARANGVMWGSKVLGISLTLVLGTWAINTYGFRAAVMGLNMVMLLVLLLPSLVRERQGERLFPWTKGAPSPKALVLKAETWGDIFFTLKSVFLLRNSLIAALGILLWGTAAGLKDALAPVFTIQQLGWDNSAYADLVAVAKLIGALCAMILAGWLADRVGKIRIISIYVLTIALAWVSLAVTTDKWSTSGYFNGFIYGIEFLEIFGVVAVLATAMNLCWSRVAATQFTLYMVCNNLGIMLGAMLLGPLRANLSWSGMFLVLAAMLGLALVLLQFIRLRHHLTALHGLEESFVEKAARKALGRDKALPVDLGVPGSVV